MSNKSMKLHTQKGKRRLWLEEQKYGLPGFKPGSRFNVVYNEDSVAVSYTHLTLPTKRIV